MTCLRQEARVVAIVRGAKMQEVSITDGFSLRKSSSCLDMRGNHWQKRMNRRPVLLRPSMCWLDRAHAGHVSVHAFVDTLVETFVDTFDIRLVGTGAYT